MLFNSAEFIFLFLPVTLAGFFLLGLRSRSAALNWLILASLFFYAWWRPFNVLLIAPSIVVNFFTARLLLRLRGDRTRASLARVVLVAGILFNVAFLGYFKYRNFFLSTMNDVFGTHWTFAPLILPLAISFITFQKIAFLVDVHGGRVESFTLRDYALFVLFFPQLIAGPIVHYREVMPQFRAGSGRLDATDAAVGVTLFFTGLFKKVVFADGIATYVSPLFQQAAAGTHLTLLPAWAAALGYTLQLYFDFSGYSDMALGLARFFGVRLPVNFDSPLRASSIIDYWLRWHITLTRFLTAYIYSPLALALTRRRMARRLPGIAGRNTGLGAFFGLHVVPTMITMAVSGLWHGAGYLFVLWGLLHGVYLSINQGWRLFGPARWMDAHRYRRLMQPIGFALTFLAVVVGMVLFRAPSMRALSEVLGGMAGRHGRSLPAAFFAYSGRASAWLTAVGVRVDGSWSAHDLAYTALYICALGGVALLLPNTLQLMARYEPALGVGRRSASKWGDTLQMEWTASLLWAGAACLVVAVAVSNLAGPSEFLYWQF